MYDMKVIDAEIVDRYGGTIRVEVSADKSAKISQSIDKLISYERRFGLFENKTWNSFKNRVIKSKNDLMETFLFRPEMLISLKAILSL